MNKRLIIIFVSIAVIVLTLVLSAVIFTVNDVKILVSGANSEMLDKTDILNISGIKRGTSIFTVDEEQAEANIEKEYPNAKVVTIERIFPNQIRINIVVRVPIMAMKVAETDKHVILDREFKILEVLASSEVASRELVIIEGSKLVIGDVSTVDSLIGSFVNTTDGINKGIHETILALETYGNINERLCSFADSIVVHESGDYLYVNTSIGAKLVVRLETTKSTVVQIALVYNYLDDLGVDRSKDWFIYMDNNGKVLHADEIIL